jgi:hypothetical protein
MRGAREIDERRHLSGEVEARRLNAIEAGEPFLNSLLLLTITVWPKSILLRTPKIRIQR